MFVLRLTVCKRNSGRDKKRWEWWEDGRSSKVIVTTRASLCFPLGLSGVIRADRQRKEYSENDTALSEVSVLH